MLNNCKGRKHQIYSWQDQEWQEKWKYEKNGKIKVKEESENWRDIV